MNPKPQRTSHSWTIFILPTLAVVTMAAAIYVKLTPAGQPVQADQAVRTAQDEQTRLEHPDKTFSIVMHERQQVSGPSQMSVKRGDSVRVNLSQEEDEARVKLEGYNVITEASPDAPGGFSFIADKAGDFSYYALPEGDEPDQKPVKLGEIIVR